MEEKLILHAGWMIDGTGKPVQKNIRLEVEEGKILTIRTNFPVEQKRVGEPDFSNCTLLPGLIDCHAHLFMSGTGDPVVRRKQLRSNYDEIKEVMQTHIQAHLRYGVMAVRDGGDYGDFAARFKEEFINQGIYPGFLKVAGRAWYTAGRYGKMIGRAIRNNETLGQAIIREGKNKDQVKIIQSGLNSLTVFGKETRPQFSIKDLEGARMASGRLGLKLMVHANGRLPVKEAVEAGSDSIEHGFFMGDENVIKMASRGTFWVPTAVTMKAYSLMMEPESIEAKIAKRNLNHQLNQIKKAREVGVNLAVGTDAGSLGVHHGQAVMEEIGLLQEAGLTVEEAIRCATFNGATLLGLDKEIGCLKPGFWANFILVEGDPSRFPSSLTLPQMIYLRGRPV